MFLRTSLLRSNLATSPSLSCLCWLLWAWVYSRLWIQDWTDGDFNPQWITRFWELTNSQFDLEVLECRNDPGQRQWVMLNHSFIHSFILPLIHYSFIWNEASPSARSNSAQILVILHVSTYLHHSGNFHFRNKQLFIVHIEDIGRYNDLYFPSPVIYVF